MRPSDWLLVLLASEPGGPLDPVRLQKGMFLVAMQAGLNEDERYAFEPYAYGPMSRALYGDVRVLARAGLLDAVAIEGAAWRVLRLTTQGRERAAQVALDASRDRPDAVAALSAIRREITDLGFADLLRRVYDDYPEYAVRSVFRRRG